LEERAPSEAPSHARQRPLWPRAAATALAVAAIVAFAGLATGTLAVGQTPGAPRVGIDVPATATNQEIGPANNSPSLVADPTEARFVVLANRLDAPDFGCALQLSGDGGRSFVPANPVQDLPAGADKCYAPEVAFDRSGLLYYLYVGLSGNGNHPMGVFLTTSSDRGRTFGPARQVLGASNFSVRMAIDAGSGKAGRIHLVWVHASSDPPLGGFAPTPNPILSAYSDDGGTTFSQPVQVSDPGRDRVVAPALAVGSDHAVHVAYYDLGRDAVDYQGLEGPVWDGTWSVVLATSTDGGGHFGPVVTVDDKVAPVERIMLIFTMPPPSLAVDGQRACLAWTDARFGDADAVVRCSGDGGRRWTDLRRLNDDPAGNGVRQYTPRLALAPGGRLDAIFYDRRDDPEHLGTQLYYTDSTDGGRHFARNLSVTTDPIDPRNGPQYANVSAQGQVEFGSRLGLLSRRDGALLAWTDTRNSRPYSTGQDIFVAQVRYRSARQAGWARVVGVALVVAGIISLFAIWRRRRPSGPVPA